MGTRAFSWVLTIGIGAIGFVHADDTAVSYNRDVRQILSNNCFACHGPDENARKRRPRLDTAEGATAPARSGRKPIVPGDPAASEMIYRIAADDPEERMPPPDKGAALSAQEIATLRRWIEQGAEYELHWSYEPPAMPALPAVSDGSWIGNPIDAFVLARLDEAGLAPNPEADERTLVRRVYLDLVGIPPTPDEIDQYFSERRSKRYERLVDRLLESPRYGEHWARRWLDLARYADSKGYEKDDLRTMWPYRDWVIRALNADMPFDEFTVRQIAGDLLPEAEREDRVATAFHRNTMTNDEGGTDDEEFRVAAVVDRVNTTFQTWMGTTINCAQCHTHKYDPITQSEYYEVYDFFNQTADADLPDERPFLLLASDRDQARLDRIDARIEDVRAEPESEKRTKRLEQLEERRSDFAQSLTRIPIMEAVPADERRTTHVLRRGSFLSPGEEVSADVPEVFHDLPEDAPRNRLTFAKWLVSEANPLTARVTVNRYWEAMFGAGIVRTSEEFGTQGELPSHPDLLDWLAVDFMESGWSLKHLCRRIVMSATYRQASTVSEEKLERDPDNRLLARGPRFRLDAEVIRDAALAVSGLLSDEMYGPPVMPPQPDGIWNVVYSDAKWEVSKGEDRYRRGLYTFWRRTAPYPSMITFDATSREVCTVRRVRTNTPLQALVLMNDPVYVEAARALGRAIAEADWDSDEERVAYAVERVLGREPTDAELARLLAFYEDELEATGGDRAEAWGLVAHVLMNLDEFVTKT